MTYGERYLRISHFISYCAKLNVKTDHRKLEHYEREGIMYPVARVVKPDEYVKREYAWQMQPNLSVTFDEWPDMARLYESLRDTTISDEELVESFDREFGRNPCLVQPALTDYSPWDAYKVVVTQANDQDIYQGTVEHFYSHWQVHQLYLLQQSPDLYANYHLLTSLCDACKAQQLFRPWVMEKEQYRTFEGMATFYDALSFYITMYNRERRRTFAHVPELHRIKTLDATQHEVFQQRLRNHAQFVITRYALTENHLFTFLHFLLEKLADYRDAERAKLAGELSHDIRYLASFLWAATGKDWEGIADEIAKTNYYTKQAFRHLDSGTKVRDTARDALAFFFKENRSTLSTFGIIESDIDGLLRFCDDNDLSLLLHTLDDSIATLEEEKKFLRITRYVTFKNFAMSLEFFLKALAQKAVAKGRADLVGLEGGTLVPVITKVMKNETAWIHIFGNYSKKAGPADFSANLAAIQAEPNDIARHFLLACLARNLTVHRQPIDDWFYGDLFGELLRSIQTALFYSWSVAKREHWV
jgi:hypothetical protein